jgi:hypothetical protein
MDVRRKIYVDNTRVGKVGVQGAPCTVFVRWLGMLGSASRVASFIKEKWTAKAGFGGIDLGAVLGSGEVPHSVALSSVWVTQ